MFYFKSTVGQFPPPVTNKNINPINNKDMNKDRFFIISYPSGTIYGNYGNMAEAVEALKDYTSCYIMPSKLYELARYYKVL